MTKDTKSMKLLDRADGVRYGTKKLPNVIRKSLNPPKMGCGLKAIREKCQCQSCGKH